MYNVQMYVLDSILVEYVTHFWNTNKIRTHTYNMVLWWQYVHGIYMDIHGYTWYIMWFIYMVNTWYIHGYSWICLAFWNKILRPASAAGLIRCAHVCGWSREFYSTHHHGDCARGKGCPQKAQPCSRQPPPSVACGGGDGCDSSGAAGVFPFLVAGNELNLGESWSRGSLKGRWPMSWTA